MSEYNEIKKNDGTICMVRFKLESATDDPLTDYEIIINELVQSKAEMLEALIMVYKTNEYWGRSNYHRWSKDMEETIRVTIEKATGQKIEDLI